MKLYPLALIAALVGCSEMAPSAPVTADSSTAPAAEAKPFNPAHLPTVSISTPSMHCPACAAGIEGVLAKTAGVKDVQCDVDSQTVTLAVDTAEFDKESALASLDEAGFSESVVQ